MEAGTERVQACKRKLREVELSIKSKIMEFVQRCSFGRKMVLYFSNQLHLVKGNTLFAENIHFCRNVLNMSSKGDKLICDSTSFMRHCIVNLNGASNIIKIDANTEIYGNGVQTFHVDGKGNEIIIGRNCVIRNTTFFIWGNNNKIRIGDNCSLMGVELHVEQNSNEINIGNGTTFHGREGYPIHMAVDEGSRIVIEDDCMLSNGIQIRSTDSHSIVDLQGYRLNRAEDIFIGKHCWISLGCIILKGTHIADCTVVAAGAVCTKKYLERNCIIAGNPAKVVKKEVDWDRKFL